MDLGLAGRACAVTGASSGIGLATARILYAEGARVLLVARGEDRLTSAAQQCAGAGGEAATLALDVTEPDSGERLVAEATGRFGRLDVLVNNAGTSRPLSLEEATEADFNEQWELSVLASLRAMRAAVPGMRERGFGRIVNVSSSAGKRPGAQNPAYSVAKAAQLSLSRTFADRYAADGVLVNAVCPGPVTTPLWLGEGALADSMAERAGLDREAVLEQVAAKRPAGRLGEAEEIAAVIAFLCSEQASYVVGAAWSVDGGTVEVII